VSAHLPGAPRWLIWGWFLTIPWTVQFSAHLINTSYILPGSVMFFLGFFESVPWLSLRRLPAPVAHALMGAALTWLMQIHMSWPLLAPFALLAWISRWNDGPAASAKNAAAFCAGALVPAKPEPDLPARALRRSDDPVAVVRGASDAEDGRIEAGQTPKSKAINPAAPQQPVRRHGSAKPTT